MDRKIALTAALTVTLGVLMAPPAQAAPPQPDVACVSNGAVETVVYGEKGNGVLVVGDEFASRLVGPREGKPMLGGKLTSISDKELTALGLFDSKAEESSPEIQGRNAIATGPSKIVVAFRSGATVTSEAIARVSVLAGERDVLWVAPLGNSKEDSRARLMLAGAQNNIDNLAVMYPRLMVSTRTQAKPGLVTDSEINDVWREAGSLLKSGDRHRVVKVSEACEEAVPTVDAGESLRADALEFAASVVGNPSSVYTAATTTNPFASPYPYNCSTLIAAAYRFASSDVIQLEGFSDSQLWDTENIELVPWSEAQPGDLFFQKTMDDRFLGHVGMIWEKGISGGATVIHACGDDGWCANAAASGMGFTDISVLSNAGGLAYVINPATANVARQGNIGFTQDYTQGWYGRVKTPSSG